MRNVSDRFVEFIKPRILYPTTFFFSKIVPVRGYVEKYRRGGQAIDDIMVHVHYTMDT
jgi:hypothetical protein